jgi:hypothetical protein
MFMEYVSVPKGDFDSLAMRHCCTKAILYSRDETQEESCSQATTPIVHDLALTCVSSQREKRNKSRPGRGHI